MKGRRNWDDSEDVISRKGSKAKRKSRVVGWFIGDRNLRCFTKAQGCDNVADLA